MNENLFTSCQDNTDQILTKPQGENVEQVKKPNDHDAEFETEVDVKLSENDDDRLRLTSDPNLLNGSPMISKGTVTKSIVTYMMNDEDDKDVVDSSPNDSNPKETDHLVNSPVHRLRNESEEGIQSRIELLGELLITNKLDSVPDEYDETENIIKAIERNERFQADDDGKRLSYLANAAKSNLNRDIKNFCDEIQRQFGLYALEVTGDGSCAFRAILISGLQKPDSFHNEMRHEVIRHVLNNKAYYSTVLRPGDKVTDDELIKWAENLKDPYTYADELANISVADHYHIQLVIFRAGELLSVINPRDGDVKQTAFLVNVGTHYKALVPLAEVHKAIGNSERLKKS